MNGWVVCVSLCALLAVAFAQKDSVETSDFRSQRCGFCGDCTAVGTTAEKLEVTGYIDAGVALIKSTWTAATFSGRTRTTGGSGNGGSRGGGTPVVTPPPGSRQRRNGGPLILPSCHETLGEARNNAKVEKVKAKGEIPRNTDGQEMSLQKMAKSQPENSNTMCAALNVSFNLVSNENARGFCWIEFPTRAAFPRIIPDGVTEEAFKTQMKTLANAWQPTLATAMQVLSGINVETVSILFGTKEEVAEKPRRVFNVKFRLDKTWTDALNDNTSTEYEACVQEINAILDEMMKSEKRLQYAEMTVLYEDVDTGSARMRRATGTASDATIEANSDSGLDTDTVQAAAGTAITATGSTIVSDPEVELVQSAAKSTIFSAIAMIACAMFA